MTGKITIVYQKNADGWITSTIPEYPGAISQGRAKEEAKEMVLDALSELMEVGRAQAEPIESGEVLDFQIMSEKSA